MKTEDLYEAPQVEIVQMMTRQAVLNSSFTGEGIDEWEDM